MTSINLSQANLSSATFREASLTDANLSQANLSNANLYHARLTNADLTDAEVKGACFDRLYDSNPDYSYGGLTLSQLESTASYKAGDLQGISLEYNNLTGANLAGKNLSNADFDYAILTNADLTGAVVAGASFEFLHSYPINLGGLTFAQLQSTASYASGDLTGIGLGYNDLSGWNLGGKNLSSASFSFATLANANLSQADLTDTQFTAVTLTNADLSGADTRGAQSLTYDQLSSAITTNLIRPDGTMQGLNLSGGKALLVGDHDGNSCSFPDPPTPIAITIQDGMDMGSDGLLKFIFEADAWDSTISFVPGVPVALGGTMELTFAPGTDLAAQIGRTFDLFDWAGVAPTGTFTLVSPYQWDLSHLYSDGEVTMLPEPASLMLLAVAGAMVLRRRR